MTVHFTIGRYVNKPGQFQVICTRGWLMHPDYSPKEDDNYFSWKQPLGRKLFSTSINDLTCADCVRKLLDKKITEVQKLQEKLEKLR